MDGVFQILPMSAVIQSVKPWRNCLLNDICCHAWMIMIVYVCCVTWLFMSVVLCNMCWVQILYVKSRTLFMLHIYHMGLALIFVYSHQRSVCDVVPVMPATCTFPGWCGHYHAHQLYVPMVILLVLIIGCQLRSLGQLYFVNSSLLQI